MVCWLVLTTAISIPQMNYLSDAHIVYDKLNIVQWPDKRLYGVRKSENFWKNPGLRFFYAEVWE